jgi:hypothetical protein
MSTLPPQPAASRVNPANPVLAEGDERARRVPMSSAERTLEVDDIPGYHLHWFREVRVERAKAAGYELVAPHEVRLNNHSIGAPQALGGNTDLGSHVSVIGSIEGSGGRPERLVLMKIKEEWWQEDQAALAERNLRTMRDIFVGEKIGAAEAGGAAALPDHGYVKSDRTSFEKGGPPSGPAKAALPIMNRGMPKARTGGRFKI